MSYNAAYLLNGDEELLDSLQRQFVTLDQNPE
jgi:hypothetical protein